MKQYIIDKKFAVLNRTDSNGSQSKFHKDGYWYKYDMTGKEGLAECLASALLSCSNVKEFVEYEHCMINEREGCRSKDFIREGESLITFDKLYFNATGELLNDTLWTMQDADARFTFLVDTMKEYTGLDITEYLYQNLAIDCITRNPDRHFKNLAFLLGNDGRFRTAPIFDNGQGLLQNYTITPPNTPLWKAEQALTAATVSGSFDEQYMVALKHLKEQDKEPIQINYKTLREKLNHLPDTTAKSYLMHNLNQYKEFATVETKDVFKDCDLTTFSFDYEEEEDYDYY